MRAVEPMTTSFSGLKAITDGVVVKPSSFYKISTRPFVHRPTHEFVVPRSMPIQGSLEFEPYA